MKRYTYFESFTDRDYFFGIEVKRPFLFLVHNWYSDCTPEDLKTIKRCETEGVLGDDITKRCVMYSPAKDRKSVYVRIAVEASEKYAETVCTQLELISGDYVFNGHDWLSTDSESAEELMRAQGYVRLQGIGWIKPEVYNQIRFGEV